jgi:hypothetical protein
VEEKKQKIRSMLWSLEPRLIAKLTGLGWEVVEEKSLLYAVSPSFIWRKWGGWKKGQSPLSYGSDVLAPLASDSNDLLYDLIPDFNDFCAKLIDFWGEDRVMIHANAHYGFVQPQPKREVLTGL